jgi:tight adherence protein B
MKATARLGATVLSITGVLLTAAPALAQDGSGGSGPKQWLIVLGAIGAGVAAFLLIVILLGSISGRKDSDLRSRLGTYASEDDTGGGIFGRFRVLRRAASQAEGVAQRRGVLQQIETALEQANLPIRPGEAILAAIAASLISGLVVGAFMRSWIWGIGVAVVVLLVAGMMVSVTASRHRKKFEKQLPDTLTLISTSLRAGYSLLQAIEAVAAEAADPTAREFGRAMAEIRLGRSVTDAMNEVAERMESQDFEWAVLAISIQREVGGNLAEVLQTTAETMLQRNRLRREMHALTAEGRVSAIVLSALPIFLLGLIWAINPEYIEPLYKTTPGMVALGVAGVMIAVGIVWLQRIVTVEV